jgi:Spy/CpxP family protein refolding chaperone
MKAKILIFSLITVLAAGGFVATKALADDDSAPAPAPGRLLQRIAAKLHLSADQRAQIKTVLVGDKATLATLLAGVHDARKDLRTAIRASDASEASVRAAAANVAAAEADLAVERMKLTAKSPPS